MRDNSHSIAEDAPWAGPPASSLPVDLEVLILFPWDPETRLFPGERIWFDRASVQPRGQGSGEQVVVAG